MILHVGVVYVCVCVCECPCVFVWIPYAQAIEACVERFPPSHPGGRACPGGNHRVVGTAVQSHACDCNWRCCGAGDGGLPAANLKVQGSFFDIRGLSFVFALLEGFFFLRLHAGKDRVTQVHRPNRPYRPNVFQTGAATKKSPGTYVSKCRGE